MYYYFITCADVYRKLLCMYCCLPCSSSLFLRPLLFKLSLHNYSATESPTHQELPVKESANCIFSFASFASLAANSASFCVFKSNTSPSNCKWKVQHVRLKCTGTTLSDLQCKFNVAFATSSTRGKLGPPKHWRHEDQRAEIIIIIIIIRFVKRQNVKRLPW